MDGRHTERVEMLPCGPTEELQRGRIGPARRLQVRCSTNWA